MSNFFVSLVTLVVGLIFLTYALQSHAKTRRDQQRLKALMAENPSLGLMCKWEGEGASKRCSAHGGTLVSQDDPVCGVKAEAMRRYFPDWRTSK
jgi:hypothetical protein